MSACANDAPQDYLSPEGPQARMVDRLWDQVFPIAVVIFFIVQGLIVFAVIKFRAKSDDDAPVQVHGNAKLEFGWTIVPAALLAFVGVFTVGTLFELNRNPPDSMPVRVVGHQFWWEFRYPDHDVVTANELHIPINKPVRLTMTSTDVIHSFWAPKLSPKQDVVPGRTTALTLEAPRPGRYEGQCAEFCGASHANMKVVVVAHDEAGFRDWITRQQRDARPAAGAAAEGELLFASKGCSGCHTVEGLAGAEGKVGPSLTHLKSRDVFAGAMFDLKDPDGSIHDKNMRQWLRDPPGRKPMIKATGMFLPVPLTEDEITKLIAYLDTLE